LAASPVVNTVFMVGYVPFCELMGSMNPHPARLGVPKPLAGRPEFSLPDSRFTVTEPKAQSPLRPPRFFLIVASANFAESNEFTRIANATNYITPSQAVNPNDRPGFLCITRAFSRGVKGPIFTEREIW
jgi:hypothetical protein